MLPTHAPGACKRQGLIYIPAMTRTLCLLFSALVSVFGLVGCADSQDKKPVGPASDTSQIPWNTPVAGQGQGQFGMMPQNQYRR